MNIFWYGFWISEVCLSSLVAWGVKEGKLSAKALIPDQNDGIANIESIPLGKEFDLRG